MKKLPRITRTAAWAVLLMLTPGALTAQGTSPWTPHRP